MLYWLKFNGRRAVDVEVTERFRPDGTPMAFFYDRNAEHIIHRRRDGSLEAIGFDCRHEIEEL
ncbi:hypothetical protein SEA_TESLA_79 [Mycobacterium phage Tesla]|uniref:Uncharacterized protein n=6 Tax=Marvinvirus TaxID=1982091 RepID=G1BNE8_9CAUD|nr:hypothetical protein FDI61_gp078 [Mycobacterium phage Marvin]ANM46303.1 hypothetical protein SEA_GATTACA_81 [Mycobacterium phage Gattaca]AVE00825.1 hypothetical protein SEA_TESLA_79 [Mycobacterium phage Tesla]AYB70713.1 hypothetical protein SEA_VASUNZINGA_81 [Mycobacterium phage VasuNzinga]QFP94220.1 hypothetical protein SEA_JOIEB_84 [Mycobacterium phage JoieB]QFP97634.1 hypothetical protein SEA_CORAZON_79 [Mycobacterium phage Corazon]